MDSPSCAFYFILILWKNIAPNIIVNRVTGFVRSSNQRILGQKGKLAISSTISIYLQYTRDWPERPYNRFMPSFSVPYYELLLRLAMYQKDVQGQVYFKFQMVAAGDASTQNYGPERPAVILVQPMLAEKGIVDTLPLFNFPDLDPIVLWLSFGYISLTEGSIEEEKGVFVLTEQSLGWDLIQSAG